MKIDAVIARQSQEFECIPETVSLADAIAIMDQCKIGSVGLVSSDGGSFRGLVTQIEVIAALARNGAASLKQEVAQFMRSGVPTCHVDDDAGKVMEVITRHRRRYAIVQSASGKIDGLVSLGDLVAAMLVEARLETGVLRDMACSRMMHERS